MQLHEFGILELQKEHIFFNDNLGILIIIPSWIKKKKKRWLHEVAILE